MRRRRSEKAAQVGRRHTPGEYHLRLVVFAVVVVVLFGTLLVRLGQMQGPDNGVYARAAQTLGTRTISTPAVRGRILDRNGKPLVDNGSETVVTVERATLLKAPDGGKTLVRRVAALLRMPFAQLWGHSQSCGTNGAPNPPLCWGGSAYEPIPIASGVDPRRALSLLEQPDLFPGIAVVAEPVRRYPLEKSVNAVHVLGYLGRATAEDVRAAHGTVSDQDLVGRSGLEQQYDDVLRGTPGRTVVAVDPRGVVTQVLSRQDPVPGRDVVTTIDARVQSSAERALASAVADARRRRHPADSGAAVVLDVRSGAVLAAASYPAYRPDVWTGGISTADFTALTDPAAGTPLVSRVTSAVFPPASTFKAISLPAAVNAGNDLAGAYNCSSDYRIGDRRFRNYESRAYGKISLHRAIVVSCDTIFYDFAYRSWLAQGGLQAASDRKDPFVAMARDFGLGRRTGIDLPSETMGRIPDRAWKKQVWDQTRGETCSRARTGYPEVAKTDGARATYLKALAVENCRTGFEFRAGDEANFAIGQGDIAVTPLQMAVAYGAVANGGTLWAPELARSFVDAEGRSSTPVPPRRTGQVGLRPGVGTFLKDALTEVVTQGTASGAFRGFPLKQWPVAGKTGTGEVFGKDDTAWFVSYAPANAPKYVVAVAVSQGGTGAGTAAPAARAIHDTLRSLPGS